MLFVLGKVTNGAQSWFDFGGFSFQPVDMVKLVLVLVLAKYFSRRHVEIAHIRHILISGFYAFILFMLVLLQPDFGSAIVIFMIWFGMVMVSGISKKHLLAVFCVGLVSGILLWSFVFQDYQKQRILSFIYPLADIHGAGYNAYQSMVAVGSGQLLGKGIGYGTQSKLLFLPEYQTDFIFAAFAEEWGFIGSVILLGLFGILIWRVISNSMRGATNFETLFGLGVAVLFMIHLVVNIGMNVGLLPVTGITVPFMSYGGSHLFAEFLALGMVSGMAAYARAAHRDALNREFSGGYDH
jgi:rod shape determining protein RodA